MAYASIIIPTHNRPHLLPYSLKAAQQQTIKDIEIIVVGDGVDELTRAIVKSMIKGDRRITFCDHPKGFRSGVQYRDLAVRSARSDRIFYCDDDDLLLPSHVEILGARLAAFDFVESLPLSVSRSGICQVALANHSKTSARYRLASSSLKMTFDTHIAHTKQAYLRLGTPWISSGGDIAGSFLEKFAAAQHVQWSSISKVTALSLHGAARKADSDNARADESKNLFSTLSNIDHLELSYVWYLDYIYKNSTQGTMWDSPETAAQSLGFELSGSPINERAGLVIAMSELQRRKINAYFDFIQGRKIPKDEIVRLALELSDPILGGDPRCRTIAERLLTSQGVQCVWKALSTANIKNQYEYELLIYVLFFIFLLLGKKKDAATALQNLSYRPCYHSIYKDDLSMYVH